MHSEIFLLIINRKNETKKVTVFPHVDLHYQKEEKMKNQSVWKMKENKEITFSLQKIIETKGKTLLLTFSLQSNMSKLIKVINFLKWITIRK